MTYRTAINQLARQLMCGVALLMPLAVPPAAAQPDFVSLAELNRVSDDDRIPDSAGENVSIRATVTSDPFTVRPGPVVRIYLDDDTGGLMLQTPDLALLASVTAGDVVVVEGEIGFHHGSVIVVPTSVDVVGSAPVPAPIDVSVRDLSTEIYEGRLIRARGRLMNAQNVELVDYTGAIRVRARRSLLEDQAFRHRLYSESLVEVIGIASQYDPSAPHDSGYRIEILSTDGLVLRTDLVPFTWGLGIVLLTGLLWWRARSAIRREAYTRGLLEKVRASETALKASEERLRVVADATSDVIWELDLARRELFWQAGAKELFGVDRVDPIPDRSTHLEFIHRDDAERVGRSLAAAIEEGREDWSEEYRVVRGDGQIRHVSDRARILQGEDGAAVAVIGALLDITEARRAEQRERELQSNLQHAQRLESLGILSSGIAHDFNNILAAIVGNTDLLREAGELPPADRALLDQISSSCERGVDLTGKMLTYAGRAPTLRKSVDVNRLVTDVLSIVGKAASKHVVLDSELDPASPRVNGDPAQLQQVVMNFVTNAVDALPDGRGEVRVTTAVGFVERVKGQPIGCDYKPRRYVTLTVSDTGSGIKACDLTKIFEPFFTTKSSGRGLGLSAVVGIINSHNGCLFVDSTPNRGTTFTALLPPDTEMSDPFRAVEAESPATVTHGSVLIAEDEEFICDLLEQALATLNLVSDTVDDGKQALDRLLANRDVYDLLVLDMSMPGLNGDEIFARARKAGIETPVLFISGHGAYDLEQRVGDAENVAILAKPFRLGELRECCLRLLAAAGECAETNG